MHQGTRDWLDDLQRRYGFAGGESLLELGSLNVNGTARDHLKVGRWVGVDRVAGPGVDVVADARFTKFMSGEFTVLLSSSQIEHDADWRDSLTHNLQWLNSGGLFLLSWGAEGNQHHAPEPWRPVPVGDVLEWAVIQGLEIVGACWERSRFTADCAGAYCMEMMDGDRVNHRPPYNVACPICRVSAGVKCKRVGGEGSVFTDDMIHSARLPDRP